MVQREAAFLISLATENFVMRFSEAIQRNAGREGRATVQGKDVGTLPSCSCIYASLNGGYCLVTTVRRAEEFAFLEGTYFLFIRFNTQGSRTPRRAIPVVVAGGRGQAETEGSAREGERQRDTPTHHARPIRLETRRRRW